MLRTALAFFLLYNLACADKLIPSEGPKDQGCPITGNVDFYGSGVRIGICTVILLTVESLPPTDISGPDTVWLSSWLANNFLPEEIIGTLETNSIFLLALFATVFSFSIQSDAIRVIDVIVIHQLCVGFLFSVISLWGYRTMYYKTEGPGGRRHFGGISTHLRLLLMTMVTAYGVWFWIDGVAGGLPEIDERGACGGLVTFFVVPLKVTKWSTRGVFLTTAILSALYYGKSLCISIVRLISSRAVLMLHIVQC